MTIKYFMTNASALLTLKHGDCRDVLREQKDNSIDSVVTDPPYGIHFMGKTWDQFGGPISTRGTRERGGAMHAGEYDLSLTGNRRFQAWTQEWAAAAFRVLKPGAFLLCFASTRTYHRMACGIEDAGFDVRDQVAWTFGSGFPKSHNLDGEREGWGTALKPAWEPIVLARKPLIGTVAANVDQWRTGALNIAGCRVEGAPRSVPQPKFNSPTGKIYGFKAGEGRNGEMSRAVGRWPANLIHDGSDEVLAAFPDAKGQQGRSDDNQRTQAACYGAVGGKGKEYAPRGDAGSAAHFFYCAKSSKKDRNDGCENLPKKPSGMVSETSGQHITRRDGGAPGPSANYHPTVKPTELMRYLCRLVTPPHGIILDPFMGSGSTGRGAALEGFSFIGIEKDTGYWEIAKARVAKVAS